MVLALLMFLTLPQQGSLVDKNNPVEEDPINAQIFTENGERLYLLSVKVKGVDPHHFEFQTAAGSSHVNIQRITRIMRLDEQRYEILFDSGEKQVGKIRNLTLKGKRPDEDDWVDVRIKGLLKAFLVSGARLRSCPQGHYEEKTLYPFCPMCGAELDMGSYQEIQEEREDQTPTHRLRLNTRYQ